jgi:hypothetical protein
MRRRMALGSLHIAARASSYAVRREKDDEGREEQEEDEEEQELVEKDTAEHEEDNDEVRASCEICTRAMGSAIA